MEKYRDWYVLDELPDGWVIDKTAGSPLPCSVFITNGNSVLNGQKRAILRVKSNYTEKAQVLKPEPTVKESLTVQEDYFFPAKTVNELARKKFQEKLLQEVSFDLMVCQIEGWDKSEYIKQLQELLNSFKV